MAEKGNLDEHVRIKETYNDDVVVPGKSGGFKKRKTMKKNKQTLVQDDEV